MGRTHGVNSMITTAQRQNTLDIAPVPRAPGATLWAFLTGILVGIALGVLR